MKPHVRFNWRKEASKGELLFKSSIPTIILLVIIALVIYISNNRVQRQLSQQLFVNDAKAATDVIDRMYEPLLNSLKISNLWVRAAGYTELREPDGYEQELAALCEGGSLIRSLSLRDGEGREISVYPEEAAAAAVEFTEQGESAGLSAWRAENGMDFTQLGIDTDSFVGTENPGFGNLRISEPYDLPYSNETGLTIYYRLHGGEKRYLELWLDISLQVLARQMADFSVNRESVIFILLNDNEYLLYPVEELLHPERIMENPGLRESAAGGASPIIRETYEILNEGRPGNDVFSLETADERWWVQLSRLHMPDGDIVIGSFAPESTLLLSRIQSPVIIVSVVILILVGIYFYLLFDDYRKVLREHVIITEEEKLRRKIALGENLYYEFKSSLRWDYREEKPNKILETVIMKSISAFSNSDGGTLLIGVSDEGEILGLEKDYQCLKEPGRDYFELHLRTLLSNMFGVAYPVSHIKVDFPVLEEKEICRIKIKEGDEPLYLISQEKGKGNTEKFYVRSGNSSRQIGSVRDICDYIVNRFR